MTTLKQVTGLQRNGYMKADRTSIHDTTIIYLKFTCKIIKEEKVKIVFQKVLDYDIFVLDKMGDLDNI